MSVCSFGIVLLCTKQTKKKKCSHHTHTTPSHNVKQYPMVQFGGLDFADSAFFINKGSERERDAMPKRGGGSEKNLKVDFISTCRCILSCWGKFEYDAAKIPCKCERCVHVVYA